MIKVKILALLAVMALFLTLPAVIFAQQVPPHVFVGTAATVDGAAAAGPVSPPGSMGAGRSRDGRWWEIFPPRGPG